MAKKICTKCHLPKTLDRMRRIFDPISGKYYYKGECKDCLNKRLAKNRRHLSPDKYDAAGKRKYPKPDTKPCASCGAEANMTAFRLYKLKGRRPYKKAHCIACENLRIQMKNKGLVITPQTFKAYKKQVEKKVFLKKAGFKICKICDAQKPFKDFGAAPTYFFKDGSYHKHTTNQCLKCLNKKSLANFKANREYYIKMTRISNLKAKEELKDSYVKQSILWTVREQGKKVGVRVIAKDITPEMIETKRKALILTRKIKKHE